MKNDHNVEVCGVIAAFEGAVQCAWFEYQGDVQR